MDDTEVPNATLKTAADESGSSENRESSRHRLQLDFSPEAFRRLQEIRARADAKTNAEVIRNALRLYEWFLEQKRSGFRIQLVQDNLIKEVEILM